MRQITCFLFDWLSFSSTVGCSDLSSVMVVSKSKFGKGGSGGNSEMSVIKNRLNYTQKSFTDSSSYANPYIG